MTKKVVTKKSSKTSLNKTKDIKVSIQFSLDGFSFCVSDFSSKKDIFFTEYTFDETQNSPEDLFKKIETIFKSDENLQLEYKSVEVIHQNNLATLVPTKYFDEKSLATYLGFNIKTLKTDFIAFDEIACIEAKNVYIPYVNINNYLFQNFGEFDYKHHNTVLLEKLLKLEIIEKTMFVNVSKNNFDLVVLEDKKLILSNSFSYSSKEDFIYYILFTAEQLQLDAQNFNLYFTGDIIIDDENYKITYNYIKNVFFLESENALFNELDISKHSNYILLG